MTHSFPTRRSSDLIAWKATGGVCDGNNIAACGVPVVVTMGPRGGAIHSADEFLIVGSLPERARLSALTLSRLAERGRSEEHTSELQSLMRISYAVFCLKKKNVT